MPTPVLADVSTAPVLPIASGGQADNVLDLVPHLVDVGGGQVDLVDHRHDLMVVLDRLIDVGEGLRLDPLGRVDDEQGALARRQAPADLIGEVHVPRRVHQVEDVIRAVLRAVIEPHRLRLDRDAALLLQFHIVEHLARHLARGEAAGGLDQPVGQGRFAMVDVRDDAEIADVGEVGHWTRALAGAARIANRGVAAWAGSRAFPVIPAKAGISLLLPPATARAVRFQLSLE